MQGTLSLQLAFHKAVPESISFVCVPTVVKLVHEISVNICALATRTLTNTYILIGLLLKYSITPIRVCVWAGGEVLLLQCNAVLRWMCDWLMVFHLRLSTCIYVHFSVQPLWVDEHSGNSLDLYSCKCWTSWILSFSETGSVPDKNQAMSNTPWRGGSSSHHRTHTVVNGVCLGLNYLKWTPRTSLLLLFYFLVTAPPGQLHLIVFSSFEGNIPHNAVE